MLWTLDNPPLTLLNEKDFNFGATCFSVHANQLSLFFLQLFCLFSYDMKLTVIGIVPK